MIQLENIAPNLTRIWLPSGATVWFSYSTPVAFSANGVRYITAEKLSRTTSRQINKHVRTPDSVDLDPATFAARLEAIAS